MSAVSRRRPARRRPVRRRTLTRPVVAVESSSPVVSRARPRAQAPSHLRERLPSGRRQLSSQPTHQPIPTSRRWVEDGFTIPTGYGDHLIVLMVKDPWWLYAYWEIQPHLERQARHQLKPEEIEGLRSVLRVYNVTDQDFPAQPAHHWFDIALSGLATNWYIHVNAPNRSFIVELGLLTRFGRFLVLVRSNRVTTPRFGPSDVLDEEWMVTDEEYWRLFGMTAGLGMGSSPSGLKELLARRISSPGLFSPGPTSPANAHAARGFRLWVDAELIVYGATDPKATVTIQGQPVKLIPDGSFSARMALPDGTQTIPVEATSPDRQEIRTITPTVTRRTDGRIADRQTQLKTTSSQASGAA